MSYTYEELEIPPPASFDYSKYPEVRFEFNSGLVPILWRSLFK